MKILLVIDDYATSNNGTSVSCQRFAAELKRQGHEVRVLSYMKEPADGVYGLPENHTLFNRLVHSYGFHFALPVPAILYKAIAWADIVHFMMPFMLTIEGKRIADKLGKPSTVAFHIQPENLLSGVHLGKVQFLVNRMYKAWWLSVYSHFQFIHCPSRFMAREMKRHGYTGDIRPISNGISEDFVYHRTPKSPEFEGKIVIAMVGRLAREKRQDVIINAAMRSRFADKIQLVFAGQGPLLRKYQNMSKPLANPPIFGYYTKAQLIDILSQTDLYVHASDMESEAISCIEAFAVGLVPIIANSADSATPQFALDERSLFKPGDADDLAAHIDYWLTHPEERAAMEVRYAESAKEYTLENSVRRCVQMFQDAIDTNKQKEGVSTIE